eukprot:TRINITY_DN6598_c2_g1_i1.p1 TRINITY_DN6598_c2_g1~~TRINITY_DN6598_c2_g1_i1.p1  ORF type:complete len:216 (-),score=37.06 TRINITY_DN6598_c2_g1_i1:424-1050(-)
MGKKKKTAAAAVAVAAASSSSSNSGSTVSRCVQIRYSAEKAQAPQELHWRVAEDRFCTASTQQMSRRAKAKATKQLLKSLVLVLWLCYRCEAARARHGGTTIRRARNRASPYADWSFSTLLAVVFACVVGPVLFVFVRALWRDPATGDILKELKRRGSKRFSSYLSPADATKKLEVSEPARGTDGRNRSSNGPAHGADLRRRGVRMTA